MNKILHVAVLKGGWSAEREVSLVSGAECAKALVEAGFKVTEIDIDRHFMATLDTVHPDVVFNALHGRWGEDGCVQGILECLEIPYTHSGVLASALAMDKERCKDTYRLHDIPVADSFLAKPADIAADHLMDGPYVVKPYNEGSSVGVHIVMDKANQPPQVDLADAPELLMVEQYAPGREMTVAVMGDKALAVTEIASNTGWYDYDAKYLLGGSDHEIPADLPKDIYDRIMEMALISHKALGCRGVSRSDFRYDENGSIGENGIVILETNTQPGMTPTSLVPEQAAYCGMSFPELVSWMVEDASCNR